MDDHKTNSNYFFTSFMLNLKMEQPIDQFILSNMEGNYRMYLYFKYLFNAENRLTARKVRSHRVSEWVYLKKVKPIKTLLTHILCLVWVDRKAFLE